MQNKERRGGRAYLYPEWDTITIEERNNEIIGQLLDSIKLLAENEDCELVKALREWDIKHPNEAVRDRIREWKGKKMELVKVILGKLENSYAKIKVVPEDKVNDYHKSS